MIGQEKLERLISEKKIELAITKFESDGSFKENWLNINDKNSNEYKEFNFRYFGDRLSITLGPIIKSHNKEYFNKRPKFKNWLGCSDLRDNNNKLLIYPNEVLSVSSIERIRINGNFAAITLPKLSNADSGLLYVTSYVDPYWDGILQAVIINLTDQIQELTLGEKIAICRFYEIDGDVQEETRINFPSKSHHFGNNWYKVITESSNPFPMRKQPVGKYNQLEYFSDKLKNHWKAILGSLTTGISFLGLIFMFGTFHEKITKLEASEKQVRELKKQIVKNKDSIKLVKSTIASSGETIIPIKPNDTLVSKTISLNRANHTISSVWARSDNKLVKSIKSYISKDPSKDNHTIITIELTLNKPISNMLGIPVTWAVIN